MQFVRIGEPEHTETKGGDAIQSRVALPGDQCSVKEWMPIEFGTEVVECKRRRASYIGQVFDLIYSRTP